MNSVNNPLAVRRLALARTVVSLVNRPGPLNPDDRRRLGQVRREMDELESQLFDESQRRYKEAFSRYLRRGLERSQFQAGITSEERSILVAECRMDSGGAYPGSLGGFFAPVGFEQDVESAMKDYSAMLDLSTIYDTESGAPRAYPEDNDATVAGELINEDFQVTEADIADVDQVTLGSFKFSSKLIKISAELVQDGGFPLEPYLAERLSIRLARAANPKFTNGSGTKEPTGILGPAAVGAIALGSSINDGTSAGTNTIGSDDLANLEASVDPAYRIGANFMMHPNTISAIRHVKDKNGRPLNLISEAGTIFGYPVRANWDMDQLQSGPSSPVVVRKTVAFGNFKKYAIRRAPLVIKRLDQRFVDYSQIAFLGIQRMDGNLVDGGGGAVKVLTNAY